MDTDKHGWGQTLRRRERGEAQSEKISATLCELCASAFGFVIRVNPCPSVVVIQASKFFNCFSPIFIGSQPMIRDISTNPMMLLTAQSLWP